MYKSQEYLLKKIKEIGGTLNESIYKSLFESFTKKEYEAWVEDFIRNGIINVIIPLDGSVPTSKDKTIELIEKSGGSIYGPLEITSEHGTKETPISFLVMDMNIRIPTQTSEKGLAVSDDQKVNPMTGQVSAVSKLTSPEMGILYGLNLNSVIKEMTGPRGGDVGSMNALRTLLSQTGKVSLEELNRFSTGRKSTKTMDAYFKAIHINIFN